MDFLGEESPSTQLIYFPEKDQVCPTSMAVKGTGPPVLLLTSYTVALEPYCLSVQNRIGKNNDCIK